MKTIAAGALACALVLGMSGAGMAQNADPAAGTDTQMNGGASTDTTAGGTMMKKPMMKKHMAKKPAKHHAMKKPMKSDSTM